MRCTFEVDARPVPQGSMVGVYNRKTQLPGVRHAAGTALALWRAIIREQAKAAGASQSPLPISLYVLFGMPRPRAHLELRRGNYVVKMQYYYDMPAVAPDIDKLLRAVMDALTGVCYYDDKQVVQIIARKHYAETTLIDCTDEEVSSTPQITLGLGQDSKASADEG